MIRRFCQYATKVFDLPVLMARLQETRRDPLYSTACVWETMLTLLVTGRGSLHAVEADRLGGKTRNPKRGTGPPSDDTLGRVFNCLDPEPVRQMLTDICHRLKRNKALPLLSNLRFAAVDGHEFFSQ